MADFPGFGDYGCCNKTKTSLSQVDGTPMAAAGRETVGETKFLKLCNV